MADAKDLYNRALFDYNLQQEFRRTFRPIKLSLGMRSGDQFVKEIGVKPIFKENPVTGNFMAVQEGGHYLLFPMFGADQYQTIDLEQAFEWRKAAAKRDDPLIMKVEPAIILKTDTGYILEKEGTMTIGVLGYTGKDEPPPKPAVPTPKLHTHELRNPADVAALFNRFRFTLDNSGFDQAAMRLGAVYVLPYGAGAGAGSVATTKQRTYLEPTPKGEYSNLVLIPVGDKWFVLPTADASHVTLNVGSVYTANSAAQNAGPTRSVVLHPAEAEQMGSNWRVTVIGLLGGPDDVNENGYPRHTGSPGAAAEVRRTHPGFTISGASAELQQYLGNSLAETFNNLRLSKKYFVLKEFMDKLGAQYVLPYGLGAEEGRYGVGKRETFFELEPEGKWADLTIIDYHGEWYVLPDFYASAATTNIGSCYTSTGGAQAAGAYGWILLRAAKCQKESDGKWKLVSIGLLGGPGQTLEDEPKISSSVGGEAGAAEQKREEKQKKVWSIDAEGRLIDPRIGKPWLLYRGIKRDYADRSLSAAEAGLATGVSSWYKGIYFTPEIEHARVYAGEGGKVLFVNLTTRNPLVVTTETTHTDEPMPDEYDLVLVLGEQSGELREVVVRDTSQVHIISTETNLMPEEKPKEQPSAEKTMGESKSTTKHKLILEIDYYSYDEKNPDEKYQREFGKFDHGQKAILSATSLSVYTKRGYKFIGWREGERDLGNSDMLEVVMDSDKVITACFSWEKVKGGLNVDEIMEEVKGSRRIDTKEILEEVKRMRKDPGKLDINAIMQDVQTQGSSTTTYHIMEDVTRKGRRKQ